MAWGLVARADNGGLGTLSWEIARHLHPDRILIVSLPDPVGQDTPERLYAEVPEGTPTLNVYYPRISEVACREFLSGLDVVLCLETSYDDRFWGWARDCQVRTHLYAMPELLSETNGTGADRVWFPEPLGTAAGARVPGVLPWPCSPDADNRWPLERVPFPDQPVRLLHQTGRAMLDRNGTDALLRACQRMTQPCQLTIVGRQEDNHRQIGPVDVRWTSWQPDEWRALYQTDDLLVLPRRYGWLSLPMLESAAAGMACVTTDLHPQRSWFDWAPELLIPAANPRAVPMKGGQIDVWEPDVTHLAGRLDRLVSQPAIVADLGLRAHAWALGRSWDQLAPYWQEALES